MQSNIFTHKSIRTFSGWLIFIATIGLLATIVPSEIFNTESEKFIFIIGLIGIWRYSIGIIHFVRGMWFMRWTFPKLREKINKMGKDALPPHVYLMVTSFRIDSTTTAKVYNSVFEEANKCGISTTIVASIVEVSDEFLIRNLFEQQEMLETVSLVFVRIPGTGKRDALASGFRYISRDLPAENAVVAVIDGDTMLGHNCVLKAVPFFSALPNLAALTTNEICEVKGSYIMSEWHKLRFGQRHINMCSMALSKRVLTLTGRMSMFRASVVTNPDFIDDIQLDNLEHWRLGRFRFLTGDDKSSWFSIMKMGLDTFYVPDAIVSTVEHPPHKSFLKSSRQLMFRWYGNNLRQNNRAVKLGPKKLGWFAYYVVNDQKISMWTSLFGLSVALLASLKYSIVYGVIYLLWIMITRTMITLTILAGGHKVGPIYPIMLYYNQIMGAVMKIYVFFRLDRQSWTRQPAKLSIEAEALQQVLNLWSSRTVTFACASIFAAVIFVLV
ncbi:glycosyltransferase family 2 protein [Parashewanella spongiae]|uniref:Glycosyltransferase family 2 protein n=2 Tax=Parashewanella spongiae TaxID=342950 RepID=A0A3A6TJH8_9GAMM|nr:glycosyltransferase family 2 protein [Parashewanella spongiae]MCL1079030.1 glycosyltransferase family 2 protein [Parashewanella spongiae]RJY10963.1 glycosyltransferase family 2 protein [Parashewanella spongiae]